MVEIDFRYRHRHLPGSLSALPIIAGIYEQMSPNDTFILSKGHSCAALYAVLEAIGLKPDCSLVHPERDVQNGVEITSGSLGHGLPIAVGMAYANKINEQPGLVYVLIGDGEAQEGSCFEALNLAAMLNLDNHLKVHMDFNGYQGSDKCVTRSAENLFAVFPIEPHFHKKGEGVRMFEEHPERSVHLLNQNEFEMIMEELSE